MILSKKVSVLITSYNFSSFIEECIRSVLQQNYPYLEVLVCDDASTDGTQRIIQTLAAQDSRIVPVFSEKNGGLSCNINRGFDRCTGEYIALLSGDDLMLPNKIGAQVAFLEENPAGGLCTHDMEVFESKTGNILYNTGKRFLGPRQGIEELFRTNWFFRRPAKVIPSSMLARADFLLAHRYDERLKFYNEWLYIISCFSESRQTWGHLRQTLGRYRIHNRQMHNSQVVENLDLEEIMIVLGICSARYPEMTPFIKDKRLFILFQYLVYGWHRAEKHKFFEKQFRTEAGLAKWVYMKLSRFWVQYFQLFPWVQEIRKRFKIGIYANPIS